MAIDFWSLWSIHKKEDNIKHPVEIFYNSSHTEIRDLFPIQKDILDTWFDNFSSWKKNNLIQLDTWAWKTLIWLFSAEALRKNKNWKILYLCPDNFLIEQTIEKAKKYWIKVSSYYSWKFINEESFLWNDTICITNYATVFSGSRFKDINIEWVIFDDSHTALELLEERFAIEINEDNNEELLNSILDLFNNYQEISTHIETVKERDNTVNIMIPSIIWLNNSSHIKLLIQKHIDYLWDKVNYNLKHNWKDIKKHLEKCLCFIWVWKIEISLLYPNISNISILNNSVDKIFLSATVNNSDDFIRFFWTDPNIISIESRYRPDRLFLFTGVIKNKIENIEEEILKTYNKFSKKNLILVPSKNDFDKFWKENNVEFVENPIEMKSKIEIFKNSDEKTLIIANRYDWIDIEWDAWHFMIILNILNHSSLKNRFFSERLWSDKNDFLRSNFAWKITQAFWRTTRSSTDYSTILIMWDKLNSTLLNSDNEKLFSRDLVEDLKIWKLLSWNISSYQDFLDIIKSNLEQDVNYKNYVQEQRTNIKWKEIVSDDELDNKKIIAEYERKINDYYLEDNFKKCLKNILDEKFEKLLIKYDLMKLYWMYLLIANYCYIKLWDIDKAQGCYDRWVWITSFLWRQNYKFKLTDDKNIYQVENILKIKLTNWLKFDNNISATLFEENIKKLWLLFWFSSIRPEKEIEWITLDNIWEDKEGKIIIWFECKNEVKNYILNKKYIGQSLDHFEWLKNNYEWYKIYYYIIWNINYRTSNTNPNNQFLLLWFEELKHVYKNISDIYIKKELFPNDLKQNLENLNLLWLENIFQKNRKVIDLDIK